MLVLSISIALALFFFLALSVLVLKRFGEREVKRRLDTFRDETEEEEEETHTLQHLQDKLLDFQKMEKKEKKKN